MKNDSSKRCRHTTYHSSNPASQIHKSAPHITTRDVRATPSPVPKTSHSAALPTRRDLEITQKTSTDSGYDHPSNRRRIRKDRNPHGIEEGVHRKLCQSPTTPSFPRGCPQSSSVLCHFLSRCLSLRFMAAYHIRKPTPCGTRSAFRRQRRRQSRIRARSFVRSFDRSATKGCLHLWTFIHAASHLLTFFFSSKQRRPTSRPTGWSGQPDRQMVMIGWMDGCTELFRHWPARLEDPDMLSIWSGMSS